MVQNNKNTKTEKLKTVPCGQTLGTFSNGFLGATATPRTEERLGIVCCRSRQIQVL